MATMGIYSYKAADFSGKVIRGTLEAEDEKGAAGKLQEMGYIPIRIHRSSDGAGEERGGLFSDVSALFHFISPKDVMLFTRNFSTLLDAGLPVDRALSIQTQVIGNKRFRTVVQDILKSVQGGAYLSDALSQHPEAFSKFYVNMVRAGEAGGVLESVLERLGDFLESSQELKDYITSAMVYPLFLVFVGGISIIILMTFVIPKFSIIFSDMGQSIPLTTRMLLWSSQWLKSWWWLGISVLTVLGYGCYRYQRTPEGKLRLDGIRMELPLAGSLIRQIETARFSRTLGTLTGSGVPILQALELVRDIVSNDLIVKALDDVYGRVKEGERLSRPLEDAGLFPVLAVQMITVGEESGKMDEMLMRVGDHYEKNVRNLVKRLISLLEPAMILIMGVVVGFIVISMLMAIFSMNEMPF